MKIAKKAKIRGVTNKLNQLVSFSCIKLKRYTKGMSLFRGGII